MSNDDIIRITDDDLAAVPEEKVITISELDLIGQTSTVSMATKPSIQWTPPAYQAPTKAAVDIMLLIDTSGSMGADDYPPNRLAAAKKAAKMFTKRKVTQNYNDRVGVIGFGGSATVFHPLDSKLEKVAISIDRLKITHSGTMVGRALQAALKELNQSKRQRRAIVLLSDGGDEYDTSNPVKVAQNMNGIKIFTIGMGTLKGGMAKLPHGRQKVFLNEKILKKTAKASGGEYLYAPDVPELQKIYLKLADY